MRKLYWAVFTVLLTLAAVPAFAAPATCTVEFFEDGSYTATCDKDISNVVVADCEGNTHKHDDLSGKTFSEGDAHENVTVWVKSGNNHSGDGPGYGERFDNPWKGETVCVDAPSPTPTPEPTETGSPTPGPTPTVPGEVSPPRSGPKGGSPSVPEHRDTRPTEPRLAHTGGTAWLVVLSVLGLFLGVMGIALVLMSKDPYEG